MLGIPFRAIPWKQESEPFGRREKHPEFCNFVANRSEEDKNVGNSVRKRETHLEFLFRNLKQKKKVLEAYSISIKDKEKHSMTFKKNIFLRNSFRSEPWNWLFRDTWNSVKEAFFQAFSSEFFLNRILIAFLI
jgi:hypothetical protein